MQEKGDQECQKSDFHQRKEADIFLYKDFFLLITNEKKLLVLKTVGVETEELIKIIKEADILFEKREEPFNIYEYCKK